MKNRRLWFRAFASIVILVGISYGTIVYLNTRHAGALQFGPGPAASPYLFWGRLLGLIAITFMGIIASYVFEQVRNASDPVDMRAILRNMWKSPRFITAMVVSPLVFNSIYLIIGDLPQSVADFYLAFQNGFGWERIINGLGSPNAAPPKNKAQVGVTDLAQSDLPDVQSQAKPGSACR